MSKTFKNWAIIWFVYGVGIITGYCIHINYVDKNRAHSKLAIISGLDTILVSKNVVDVSKSHRAIGWNDTATNTLYTIFANTATLDNRVKLIPQYKDMFDTAIKRGWPESQIK